MFCQRSDLRKTLKHSQSRDLEGIFNEYFEYVQTPTLDPGFTKESGPSPKCNRLVVWARNYPSRKCHQNSVHNFWKYLTNKKLLHTHTHGETDTHTTAANNQPETERRNRLAVSRETENVTPTVRCINRRRITNAGGERREHNGVCHTCV